jgi:hypothetical protein
MEDMLNFPCDLDYKASQVRSALERTTKSNTLDSAQQSRCVGANLSGGEISERAR